VCCHKSLTLYPESEISYKQTNKQTHTQISRKFSIGDFSSYCYCKQTASYWRCTSTCLYKRSYCELTDSKSLLTVSEFEPTFCCTRHVDLSTSIHAKSLIRRQPSKMSAPIQTTCIVRAASSSGSLITCSLYLNENSTTESCTALASLICIKMPREGEVLRLRHCRGALQLTS